MQQKKFVIRFLLNSEELQWSKANLIENKEIEKYQVKKKKKNKE
jgi:hypothetical protein